MSKKMMAGFIAGVVAMDVGFAVAYRRSFEFWELNPLAKALYDNGGIGAVIGFRVATMAFFSAVVFVAYRTDWWRHHHRPCRFDRVIGWVKHHAILLVAVIHLGLLATYFAGYAIDFFWSDVPT